MEELEYIDRRHTNSEKWDDLEAMFGQDDLLAMWVADMDFKAPKCVREALHRYVDMGAFGYVNVPDSYYDAVIGWEKRHHGFEIKKEWIRYSPGVVAGFNWAMRFATKPGDAVIVQTPVYYPFLDAVTNNDRTLITSSLKNTGGVYTIDFEDFERKVVDNDVKAFILCSPHNPAGRVWTRDELRRLFDICRAHGVFVISDEIHHDLVNSGFQHVPSLSVGDYEDMMITLIAPSKTFNLAALQHAVVVAPDENVRAKWDEFAKRVRLTWGCGLGYAACEAAYAGGDEWYDAVCNQIFSNYEYMKAEFAKRAPKIVLTSLEGTYLAWADLREYLGTDVEIIREFMQDKCHLAVDYGEWFGGQEFAGFIRLNLATSRENVKIAVDAICENL